MESCLAAALICDGLGWHQPGSQVAGEASDLDGFCTLAGHWLEGGGISPVSPSSASASTSKDFSRSAQSAQGYWNWVRALARFCRPRAWLSQPTVGSSGSEAAEMVVGCVGFSPLNGETPERGPVSSHYTILFLKCSFSTLEVCFFTHTQKD